MLSSRNDVGEKTRYEAAQQLLTEKGETEEWKERAVKAYEAISSDRDGKKSRGDTLTELQKEHGRRLERDGSTVGLKEGLKRHSRSVKDKTIGQAITADKDIAVRLYVAGHAPQEIAAAMQQVAPSCANLNQQEFRSYFDNQIVPHFKDEKVNAARGEVSADKIKRKMPNERRLDRLGGETKQEEFVRQQAQKKQIETKQSREH